MNTITRALIAFALTALALVGLPAAPSTAATTSGWNDWTCTPSAAHPRPVVLAHAMGTEPALNYAVLGPRLVADGYCVFSTAYGRTIWGPGLGPMEKSAEEFGAFVDRVIAATGVAKVDVVGHSEGSTVPAYYMKFLGGAQKVNTAIAFGSNYNGISLYGLQLLVDALGLRPVLDAGGCAACDQYLAGSTFMQNLSAGGAAVPGPRYVSIVSKLDRVVVPYSNGLLQGSNVTNVVLQDRCLLDRAGHVSQAIDPNVIGLVRHYLDPGRVPAPGCVPFFAFGI